MTKQTSAFWLDSHCHVDFDCFAQGRDELAQNLLRQNIQQLFVMGTEPSAWSQQISICQQYGWHYAIGMHPYFLQPESLHSLDQLEQLLINQTPIAVGEIGMDYILAQQSWPLQQRVFIEQVKLAKKYQLPIILHVRKCYDQIKKILSDLDFSHGGIVHAFSGSQQQAQQFVAMGFKLGFGGTLTYDRAKKIRQIFTEIGDDNWLLETDAPDMAPSFLAKGEINSPKNIIAIGQCAAELLGWDCEQVMQQNYANALQLFPKLKGSQYLTAQ